MCCSFDQDHKTDLADQLRGDVQEQVVEERDRGEEADDEGEEHDQGGYSLPLGNVKVAMMMVILASAIYLFFFQWYVWGEETERMVGGDHARGEISDIPPLLLQSTTLSPPSLSFSPPPPPASSLWLSPSSTSSAKKHNWIVIIKCCRWK